MMTRDQHVPTVSMRPPHAAAAVAAAAVPQAAAFLCLPVLIVYHPSWPLLAAFMATPCRQPRASPAAPRVHGACGLLTPALPVLLERAEPATNHATTTNALPACTAPAHAIATSAVPVPWHDPGQAASPAAELQRSAHAGAGAQVPMQQGADGTSAAPRDPASGVSRSSSLQSFDDKENIVPAAPIDVHGAPAAAEDVGAGLLQTPATRPAVAAAMPNSAPATLDCTSLLLQHQGRRPSTALLASLLHNVDSPVFSLASTEAAAAAAAQVSAAFEQYHAEQAAEGDGESSVQGAMDLMDGVMPTPLPAPATTTPPPARATSAPAQQHFPGFPPLTASPDVESMAQLAPQQPCRPAAPAMQSWRRLTQQLLTSDGSGASPQCPSSTGSSGVPLDADQEQKSRFNLEHFDTDGNEIGLVASAASDASGSRLDFSAALWPEAGDGPVLDAAGSSAPPLPTDVVTEVPLSASSAAHASPSAARAGRHASGIPSPSSAATRKAASPAEAASSTKQAAGETPLLLRNALAVAKKMAAQARRTRPAAAPSSTHSSLSDDTVPHSDRRSIAPLAAAASPVTPVAPIRGPQPRLCNPLITPSESGSVPPMERSPDGSDPDGVACPEPTAAEGAAADDPFATPEALLGQQEEEDEQYGAVVTSISRTLHALQQGVHRVCGTATDPRVSSTGGVADMQAELDNLLTTTHSLQLLAALVLPHAPFEEAAAAVAQLHFSTPARHTSSPEGEASAACSPSAGAAPGSGSSSGLHQLAAARQLAGALQALLDEDPDCLPSSSAAKARRILLSPVPAAADGQAAAFMEGAVACLSQQVTQMSGIFKR